MDDAPPTPDGDEAVAASAPGSAPDGPVLDADASLSENNPDGRDIELTREALTMALYLSLSLLAVLIALPVVQKHQDHSWQAAWTVFATGIGLLLAHHLAFRLSSRLVSEGLLTPESRRALKAQLVGGVPVAVLASVPVLLFGEDPGENIAILLLGAFVVLVGYRSARHRASPLRSLAYSVLVVAAALGVLAVKSLVAH